MSSPPDTLTILSRIPIFQAFKPEELREIAAESRLIQISRGEFLFHSGDQPSGFHLVTAGQLQLVISSPGGNEKIIDIISQGGTFGEAVMFLQKPYPVSAKALVDSRCLEVRASAVDALLESNPVFARKMLAGLSMRLRGLVQDVESYSLQNSAQRVITYLLQLCPEAEVESSSLTLPTSKFVIASRLNLTPETLSRVFHDLSDKGLVKLEGRKVEIPSIPALRQLMV